MKNSIIGKVKSSLPLAISILSRSTFTLIGLEQLWLTKSLRSFIDMVSIKLRTTSKHLMDISLLLKDYLLSFMSLIGIVSLFSLFTILKTDGCGMNKPDKTNCRRAIFKELIFPWLSCLVVMLCKMEGLHLIGTLHSQEIQVILSQDWVF